MSPVDPKLGDDARIGPKRVEENRVPTQLSRGNGEMGSSAVSVIRDTQSHTPSQPIARHWIDAEPYELGVYMLAKDGTPPDQNLADLVVCVVTLNAWSCYAKTNTDGDTQSYCDNRQDCHWDVEYRPPLFGLLFYKLQTRASPGPRRVGQRYLSIHQWAELGPGQRAGTSPELVPMPEHNHFVDAIIFTKEQEESTAANLDRLMQDLIDNQLCVPIAGSYPIKRKQTFPRHPFGACDEQACELAHSLLILSW